MAFMHHKARLQENCNICHCNPSDGQAAAHCCESLPQRQLQYSVTVWQADYTIQLAFMITAAMVMTAVLLVTLIYKRRLAERHLREYKKVRNKRCCCEATH